MMQFLTSQAPVCGAQTKLGQAMESKTELFLSEFGSILGKLLASLEYFLWTVNEHLVPECFPGVGFRCLSLVVSALGGTVPLLTAFSKRAEPNRQ